MDRVSVPLMHLLDPLSLSNGVDLRPLERKVVIKEVDRALSNQSKKSKLILLKALQMTSPLVINPFKNSNNNVHLSALVQIE